MRCGTRSRSTRLTPGYAERMPTSGRPSSWRWRASAASNRRRVIAEHVGVDHTTVSAHSEGMGSRADGETRRSLDVERRFGRRSVVGNATTAHLTPRKHTSASSAKTASGTPSARPRRRVRASGHRTAARKSDPYREIARRIQALRKELRDEFGEHQTIDAHLEAAWRAADDCIVIDCEQCDGGGCEFCTKGRTTKGEARTARERARSKDIAEKVRAEA